MGTVGDCYDNAPMESFWGSMQIELLPSGTIESFSLIPVQRQVFEISLNTGNSLFKSSVFLKQLMHNFVLCRSLKTGCCYCLLYSNLPEIFFR